MMINFTFLSDSEKSHTKDSGNLYIKSKLVSQRGYIIQSY